MSNAGFSAAKEYWGEFEELKAKSGGDGRTSSVSECPDEYGDTVKSDVHSDLISPSVEYAVKKEIKDKVLVQLGSIHTINGKKCMLTTVSVKTTAGGSPTVTISGVQVEESATQQRTYNVELNLTPRSKAQDVAGAFMASNKFTEITTTWSVDPHVQYVGGVPVFSDASHGRIEVQATMTDGDGGGSIAASTAGGFTVTAAPAEQDPDVNYITRSATATKFITGIEPAAA